MPELTKQESMALSRFGVDPTELREEFSRASGPGGQHVNKTSTAVVLCVDRLGLRVSARDERSQQRNRRIALRRLLEALEARQIRRRQQQAAARAQARERKARPSPAARRTMVEGKRHRSSIKAGRGRMKSREE